MAFNPSPKVADARSLAAKWDADQVIILLLNTRTGQVQGISYGKTKALCAEAEALLDQVWAAVAET